MDVELQAELLGGAECAPDTPDGRLVAAILRAFAYEEDAVAFLAALELARLLHHVPVCECGRRDPHVHGG